MAKLSDLLVTRETFESDKYQDLLANSKYERLAWDDFRDGGLVQTTAMTLEPKGYGFTAGQVLESLGLLDPEVSGYTLTECFIIVDHSDDGTPTIEITADGGANWEAAINNNIHTFSNTGTDLRIRFTAGGTGRVTSWALLYVPHTTSLTEEAVSLAGNGVETHATLPPWNAQYSGIVIYVSGEQAYYAGLADKWTRMAPHQIMQNLLSNSGFGVWGKSEALFNLTSNLCTNGTFDSGIEGWIDSTTGPGDSISWNAGVMDLFSLGGDPMVHWAQADYDFSAKKGRLCTLKFDITQNTLPVGKGIYVLIGNNWLLKNIELAVGSYEYQFVPKNDGDVVTFRVSWSGTVSIDNVEIYESGPGNESAGTRDTASAWTINLTAKSYREYLAPTEKPKTTYCMRMVPDATDGVELTFRGDDLPRWLHKLRGRSVAYGAWLWCDTADSIRLQIRHRVDTDVFTSSAWHPGDSEWHWLELTNTFPEDFLEIAWIKVDVVPGSAVVRFACPMLIYGDYIGEGNYIPKQGDVINLDNRRSSEWFDGNIFGGEGWEELNIQVDSLGAIPENVAAVEVYSAIRDAGSLAVDENHLILTSNYAATYGYINDIAGKANNAYNAMTSWLEAETDIIYWYARGSGGATLDILHYKYQAVRLQ